MCKLQKQKAGSQRQVPSLRQCLKRPQFWLALLLLFTVVAVGDTCRIPTRQVSARIYCASVNGYRWTKTELGVHPRCRFSPCCSRYSQEAVRRFGFWHGLALT